MTDVFARIVNAAADRRALSLADVPDDIREKAASLVADYGSEPAMLEGAICAALFGERLAGEMKRRS